jgi:hypothetical protein
MRRLLLVTFVLISLVSCGSEGRRSTRTPMPSDRGASEPSFDSAEAVDRRRFVGAVNDACREYAERDEALGYPEELDGYVAFMRAFIENSAELDAKLAALDPPVLVRDFDDYVAGNRRQTDILRAALPKVEAAVARDDQAEADDVIDRAIDDFNAVVDELDPYARRHGFTDCTSEPEDEA